MAMIRCSACEKEISTMATECQYCGVPMVTAIGNTRIPPPIPYEPLPHQRVTEVPKVFKGGGWAGAVAVIGFIFFMVLYSVYSDKPPGYVDGSYPTGSTSGTVKNSSWDGGVSQVKSYLKSSLKDPGSLEVIEWSPVQSTLGGHQVRCKYRAKNSLGGYIIANQIFTLDANGNVIGVTDY